jgi:predicted metal-dependent hydrolase
LKKVIELDKRNIEYTLRTSPRARGMRVSVYCDGAVVVTKPRFVPEGIVERFMKAKSKWLLSKIDYFTELDIKIFFKNTTTEYLELKKKAQEIAEKRVLFWNQYYNFSYNRIAIKNQKSRWGSCSRKGNLNFNYKIAALPEKLVDYIVIHELCHLGEFNHSGKFWRLVEKTAPDYKQSRNELKKVGIRYGN